MEYSVTLPGGTVLDGRDPIVVLGPNGSGKTRRTRELAARAPIEFVNALRNTRVAPELPMMGFDSARNNYRSQINQSRTTHWELANEFDYMLSQLLAEYSMAAIDFTGRYRNDPANPGPLKEPALYQVEKLWSQVFPGRELKWREWKPLIVSATGESPVEYSGNQMSDGEKAALFLAGRVFSAGAGIMVVDEPETHFHSLLAVRLWNALEDARPDIRFVYITHDLTFALSRRGARYVLASPTDGLRPVDVGSDVPSDVAGALLGSASLSFYASRVVFCEGEEASLDGELYNAWFYGADTVVRPVGSCQMVIRCVEALRRANIAQSLESIGIIDRDYHPDTLIQGLPPGVETLTVHEVESLFCLPAVVEAVCTHTGRSFDLAEYTALLAGSVNEQQRHAIVVERWKTRLEPLLTGIVSQVGRRTDSLDAVIAAMPSIFDVNSWRFSPQAILEEEKERVERALPGGSAENILALVPGKQLVPLAARTVGMDARSYTQLVVKALTVTNDDDLYRLGERLAATLGSVLSPRRLQPHVSADATEPANSEGEAA
jgi:hypothetical protein